ncbi:hypothetical protein SMACR_00127 [Sordaria macrospora]|uniref:Uncharacterized protein n=1 Tax=Sordaria macrospora TaxID=5147 RepID=A0A8S8ZUW6_SORMA|nr:hypothetical protein SMACR_00127 [Sordaria macrospora]
MLPLPTLVMSKDWLLMMINQTSYMATIATKSQVGMGGTDTLLVVVRLTGKMDVLITGRVV